MARRQEPERALVAVSFFLALSLAGCGREEAPPVEWRTSKELPANFPSDIPIYPTARVGRVVTGNGAVAVVVWEAPDPVPVVEQYYTRVLAEKGWQVTKYPGVPAEWMGDGGVVVIGTAWGRQLSFALGEKGDKTAITVVVPEWAAAPPDQPSRSP